MRKAYFNIRQHSAIDELHKLIKKLDYVEVNVEVLYRLLFKYRDLQEENQKLKAKIEVQKERIQDENFKNHNPQWVNVGFFIRYAQVSKRKLNYAISKGYIKHKGNDRQRQIDIIEALNYFAQRRYNNKKERS